jgi:hypothetical protein
MYILRINTMCVSYILSNPFILSILVILSNIGPSNLKLLKVRRI